MKPKLIIFDFDGVLVDSEIMGHRMNAIEFTRLGFPLTIEKSIKLFTGITKNLFDDIMLREFGKTLSENDLMTMLKKIDAEIIAHVESVKGITQILDYIEQKNINMCIATNGAHSYVSSILKKTNLSNYFTQEKIFSAEMVNYRGKPAPDVFLLAADRLQVPPEDCLVIEDGVLGIQAAKAANMPVIGFLGGLHAQSSWYYEHICNAFPAMIIDSSIELLYAMRKFENENG